jgi:phosphoglycolate phosphatase
MVQKHQPPPKPALVFDCDLTLLLSTARGPALYPGLKEVLRELLLKGHPLKIWTGRDRASLTQFLFDQGVSSFFQQTLCAGEATPKPSQEGLAKLLGPGATKSIVIGDSAADMLGAKSYGCLGLGVTWGTNPEYKITLKEAGARAIVHRVEDLLAAVDMLQKSIR